MSTGRISWRPWRSSSVPGGSWSKTSKSLRFPKAGLLIPWATAPLREVARAFLGTGRAILSCLPATLPGTLPLSSKLLNKSLQVVHPRYPSRPPLSSRLWRFLRATREREWLVRELVAREQRTFTGDRDSSSLLKE